MVREGSPEEVKLRGRICETSRF